MFSRPEKLEAMNSDWLLLLAVGAGKGNGLSCEMLLDLDESLFLSEEERAVKIESIIKGVVKEGVKSDGWGVSGGEDTIEI